MSEGSGKYDAKDAGPKKERPHGKGLHGYWLRLLTPLLSHPGVWARVVSPRGNSCNVSGSAASYINHGKKGRKALLPPGIWKAKVYGEKLYVCYIGPRPVTPSQEPR